MNDYYRPAPYQINNIWECRSCGAEVEMESAYSPGQCDCGDSFVCTGESYPADRNDWDMERDSPYDDWRYRR